MPTKRQVIEDLLGAVEQRFYEVLTREDFEDYLGAKVTIIFTTKPRLEIDIRESRKSGPKPGTKFKPRIGPSKSALREMQEDTEEF